MRTKTVLLTAVLGAASIATSVAQTVYSVNAVGYVNVVVPAGQFALLANPLNQPDNTLAAVLPDAPANTVVYVWNGTAFDAATKRATSWTGTGAAAKLNPGQGFFVKNAAATDLTITFVGEVPQGDLKTPTVVGFNLLGSPVPQAGKLETDLKLNAVQNDVVYTYKAGAYSAFTRRAATWTGGTAEPSIGVAEGFWLKAGAAGSWNRTFSVNQ